MELDWKRNGRRKGNEGRGKKKGRRGIRIRFSKKKRDVFRVCDFLWKIEIGFWDENEIYGKVRYLDNVLMLGLDLISMI